MEERELNTNNTSNNTNNDNSGFGDVELVRQGDDIENPAKQSDDQGVLCMICIDRPRNVRLPCGHGALCEECTKELLKQRSPCPNCRAPFSEYYLSDVRTLKSHPSFMTPDSKETFGKLTSLSASEVTSRTVTEIRQGGFSTVKFIGLIVVLLLALALAMLPFALAGIEIYIVSTRYGAHCDRPLRDWVVGVLVLRLLRLFRMFQRKVQNSQGKDLAFQTLTYVADITLLIFGSTNVYKSHSCDNFLYLYCWWVNTIQLNLIAIFFGCAFLACCCGICVSAARR